MNFQEFLKEKGVDLKEATAEESANAFNEFHETKQDSLKKQIADLGEAGEKKAADLVEALKKELTASQIEAKKAVDKKLEELMKAVIPTVKVQEKSLKDILLEKKNNLEVLKNSRGKGEAEAASFSFSMKAAGIMSSSNISGGNIPVEDRLPGLDVVPQQPTRLLDLVSRRTTSSTLVSWVSQENIDGDPDVTAELDSKPLIDFDLTINDEVVKKIAGAGKLSYEMMTDIPWLVDEIRRVVIPALLRKLEAQVYQGDGTGLNLRGIKPVASTFAAGDFADFVDEANEVDVLTVAITQIKLGMKEESMPTAILMNPVDIAKLLLRKVAADDRRYVKRLVAVGESMKLDGVPIVETLRVPAGDYMVGDFSKNVLVTKEEIDFQVGMSGDDFIKNSRTVIAEWRGLNLIQNNQRNAFVYGTFADDITAILKS